MQSLFIHAIRSVHSDVCQNNEYLFVHVLISWYIVMFLDWENTEYGIFYETSGYVEDRGIGYLLHHVHRLELNSLSSFMAP